MILMGAIGEERARALVDTVYGRRDAHSASRAHMRARRELAAAGA
jgi:hypothetical protein